MSFDAIRWALAQAGLKSSAKFVLVAMADCVNSEDGPEMLCWPSAQHLIDITGQDRKTILESVKRLRELGYIEDTGGRKGVTGQVAVYKLQTPEGMPLIAGETHYTYRLTDPKTGQFYIGVRTCFGNPELDTAYRGSGRWCQVNRLTGVPVDKIILGTFPDRGTADMAERLAIAAAKSDPLCMNLLVMRSKEPENGTVQRNPVFPTKEPEIPTEPTRISPVTDPKAVPGTRKDPGIEARKEPGEDPRLSTVPKNHLVDYLKVRKAKKAGEFTSTAIDGMEREAGKAGLSLADAVRVCAELGWQGFNAGWYEQRMARNRPTQPTETPYQRSMREKWETATGRNRPSQGDLIDVTPVALGG